MRKWKVFGFVVTVTLSQIFLSSQAIFNKLVDRNPTVVIDGSNLLINGCDLIKKREPTRPLKTIVHSLNCMNEDMSPKTVNFFATAVGEKYENVLPMYSFYALSSNDNAVVEMVVQDPHKFISRHHAVLSSIVQYLEKQSSGRICVRKFASNHANRTKFTNTWRYLEIPQVPANYTYISDVDIFITESVLHPERLKQMDYFDIPYSNIIRVNTAMLTGVMLVDSE
mmetsp:Transcript_2438/g.4420  ORF Transcript_2438/g.4420 Transcript_2438/m.4420 type:complete len:225 (-) Transcript_2438:838-1512(-)